MDLVRWKRVRLVLAVGCWVVAAVMVACWVAGGTHLVAAFVAPLCLGFGVAVLVVNWKLGGR